jgi:uncharacterized protein with GYD domain
MPEDGAACSEVFCSTTRSEGEDLRMPRYMVQFAYTAAAWTALTKNPQNRAEGLNALAQRMGGRLLDLYYCFGEYDGMAILELPDDTAATAAVLAAIAPGHLKSSRTTRLMSVEETMDAMRKAGSVTYAGPTG